MLLGSEQFPVSVPQSEPVAWIIVLFVGRQINPEFDELQCRHCRFVTRPSLDHPELKIHSGFPLASPGDFTTEWRPLQTESSFLALHPCQGLGSL